MLTENLQVLVAQSYRAIVFKIESPNEIRKKSVLVMTTIGDDTRAARINSTNSYLGSQSTGLHEQRKLEIKYDIPRNGGVNLSTLDETLKPEYLGYFCHSTKIPELTIDIMEC